MSIPTLKSAKRIAKHLEGMVVKEGLNALIEKSKAQVMDFDAIPLEQLKGDIGRAGHPVKRALALDPDSRRIFFTDVDGENLYAEFGSAEDNYRINRIAHQSSIAKEYDVIDLEPSVEPGNYGELVTTTHEESEFFDMPGVIPAATPGDKPQEDNRGYSAEIKPPSRIGDEGEKVVGSSAVSVLKAMQRLLRKQEEMQEQEEEPMSVGEKKSK